MIQGAAHPTSPDPSPAHAPGVPLALSQHALPALLIVFGIALATFVLYLYVLPNSQIDAAEVRIAELQAQKAALERQNAALLQEIMRQSDLKTLEVRASQLGMAPAAGVIYLKLPSRTTPGAAQIPEARGASPDTAPTGEDDQPAWWQRERLRDLLQAANAEISRAADTVLRRLRPE